MLFILCAPMALRIAFADMWQQFDPWYNFITALLRIMTDDTLEVTTPKNCDTLIYSVFGDTHQQYKNKFRIHFTGENTRPPIHDADFCISFDLDACNYGNINSTNYRLPLWWWFIDWFDEYQSRAEQDWYWGIPPQYLDQPNEFNQTPKTKFCAAVFQNSAWPRFETLGAFSARYKAIDAYGGANNLSLGGTAYDKLKLLAQYKFSLCYENSSYPGYVTEKLLHAKVAGTIPIYWGSRTVALDFNPACCLFFDGDYDKLVAEVRRLDEDDAAYEAMVQQPLFHTVPNINTGANIFFDIFQRRFSRPGQRGCGR